MEFLSGVNCDPRHCEDGTVIMIYKQDEYYFIQDLVFLCCDFCRFPSDFHVPDDIALFSLPCLKRNHMVSLSDLSNLKEYNMSYHLMPHVCIVPIERNFYV